MLAGTNTRVIGREVNYKSLLEPGDYSVGSREVWAGTLYSLTFVDLAGERLRWFILRSPFGHGYWGAGDQKRFTARFDDFSNRDALYDIGFSLQPHWYTELDDAEAAILSMHEVLHPRYIGFLGTRGTWLTQWVRSPQHHFDSMFIQSIAGGWIEPSAEERIAMVAEHDAQNKEDPEG